MGKKGAIILVCIVVVIGIFVIGNYKGWWKKGTSVTSSNPNVLSPNIPSNMANNIPKMPTISQSDADAIARKIQDTYDFYNKQYGGLNSFGNNAIQGYVAQLWEGGYKIDQSTGKAVVK